MSLRKRMMMASSGLLACLLVILVIAWVGVTGLLDQFAIVHNEYSELQVIERGRSLIAGARGSLEAMPHEFASPLVSMRGARERLVRFIDDDDHDLADPSSVLSDDDRHEEKAHEHREAIVSDVLIREFDQVIAYLEGDFAAEDVSGLDQPLVQTLDRLLASTDVLVRETDQAVADAELAAERGKHQLWVTLSTATLVSVLLALGLVVWQYRHVVTPLDRIRDGVAHFAHGELDHHIDESGDHEFQVLARDANEMARDLRSLYADLEARVREKSRELVRSERLASVGFLAAGVAHEINNPLSVIAGHAEMLLQRIPSDAGAERRDFRERITIVMEEAFRCKEITSSLLSLSRKDDTALTALDVTAICREIPAMVNGVRRYRQVSIRASADGDLKVTGSEPEMKQVLLNLTFNACEAVQHCQAPQVRIAAMKEGSSIRIDVSDNGVGIAADEIEQVFEPFYTRKRSGEPGSGLGLSIVHAIVTDRGGKVAVVSEGPGQGSRFTITLPASTN